MVRPCLIHFSRAGSQLKSSTHPHPETIPLMERKGAIVPLPAFRPPTSISLKNHAARKSPA